MGLKDASQYLLVLKLRRKAARETLSHQMGEEAEKGSNAEKNEGGKQKLRKDMLWP